jgi:hypothetical protein
MKILNATNCGGSSRLSNGITPNRQEPDSKKIVFLVDFVP